ncbi:ATPase [Betaproteobacteria bacterium]|nr:ATPase [Betaproteobacteria bacterium]
MPYIKRTIEDSIAQASRFFSVLMLTGPRQVGKTTVFKNCEESKRTYVSLDTLENRELALKDPALFLQRFAPPVLIDEIQYAPGLMSYIKAIVDERPEDRGLFWLTGSQQFHLMKGVSESLAGRVGILRLQGLSQGEKLGRPQSRPFLPTNKWPEAPLPQSLKQTYELIWKGSFPRLYQAGPDNWQLFYDAYVQTYIERDIKDLSAISSELNFLTYIKAVAARTGQLLNYADLAGDVGISQPTAKAWLSLLISSGLVYLLQPYSRNISRRLVKTPKLYFMDTGLACYLTGWKTPEVLEAGAMSGAIFETYVVSEIIKTYWHNGALPNLYFYRDSDGKEVDLLIEETGVLYPVEIKKKSNPGKSDIAAFSTLKALKTPIGPGAVICQAQTHLPITETATAIPAGYL